MKKYTVYAAMLALLAIPAMSSAATYKMGATDTAEPVSYNNVGQWVDINTLVPATEAPTSGNDYVVGLQWLRTPYANGSYVFGGDSLTITNAGGIIIKTPGTATLSIDNLILDNGGLIRSGEGSASITIFEGNIAVVGATASTISSDQNAYVINSYLSGSGDLTLSGGYAITLNGTNAMTGDINVTAGTKTFSTNSLSVFTIGANGVNNAITGTGATFNGTFSFGLTGASTTIGHSWAIATAGATYGSTFTVDGFLDNGDGSWFRDNGSAKYKFYKNTGTLEVVVGNVLPISVADIIPANNRDVFQSQPVISITLVNGNFNTVATGSIAMTLNGGAVTPGVTSLGGGSNLVSYTPASPLATGPVNIQVTYNDNAANSYTNSWSFKVHPTTTDTLWNINIAGNALGTKSNVTDGVIAKAPSAGANLWNNVAGNNGAVNTFNVTDANGANEIIYETSGSHNWDVELNGNAGSGSMTVEMFQGWAGANAPMNMTNVLSGLNPANAYDIYIYSTWAWTQNDVVYTVIEGYGNELSGTVSETWSYVTYDGPTNYSDCVEGENYIILNGVTPSAEGRIAFTGVCPDGVLSGLQILEIPGAGSRPDLFVGGTVPANGARFVTNTPTLIAYFFDVDETVNPASISMTIDGNPVSASYSKVGDESAVTHSVTSPLNPGATYTAKAVVASTPSGTLYTNQWSFTVSPAPGNTIYVDATTVNTLAWDGAAFSAWTPVAGGPAGDHIGWGYRAFGNGAEIYQSPFTTDAPRLKTTVSGLPSATYDVYVYMWVQANDWRIEAALTNNPSGELPLYKRTDYPANTLMSAPWADYDPANTWGTWTTPAINPYLSTNLLVNPFASGTVMVAEADRRLMEVYLGRVSGTEIVVYVDDDPAQPGERTWYDGIGYEEYTGGPSFDPVIHAIVVSGGNVSLTWTSETVGTYSILRKTSLTSPTWTEVKSGIAGGSPTTTDSVSASGASQEFYKIEGN